MNIYRIIYSPCEDDECPFSYGEDGLINWVDEVFLEGYKNEDEPCPTINECLNILANNGYEVEIIYPPLVQLAKAAE